MTAEQLEARTKQKLTDIREQFNLRVTQDFILTEKDAEEFLEECKGYLRLLLQAMNNVRLAIKRKATSNVVFKNHEMIDLMRSECRKETKRAEQYPRHKDKERIVANRETPSNTPALAPLTPERY